MEQEDAVHWEGHCLIQLIPLDLQYHVNSIWCIHLNVHASCAMGLSPNLSELNIDAKWV